MPNHTPFSSSTILPPFGSLPTSQSPKDVNGIPKEDRKGLDWKLNEMEVDGLPNQPLSLAIVSE